MARYKVLVVCGTGIATSTVAAEKIKDSLKSHGVDAEIVQCKALEVKAQVTSLRPDVIISTTNVKGDYGVPLFNGIPFLTGIGADTLVEQIVDRLRAE